MVHILLLYMIHTEGPTKLVFYPPQTEGVGGKGEGCGIPGFSPQLTLGMTAPLFNNYVFLNILVVIRMILRINPLHIIYYILIYNINIRGLILIIP